MYARTHAHTHTMYMCVRIHACIDIYKKCNRFIIMRLIIIKHKQVYVTYYKYITNKYKLQGEILKKWKTRDTFIIQHS